MRKIKNREFIHHITDQRDSIILDIESVLNLDEKEKSEFLHSIEAVKKLWKASSNIDTDLAK